MIRIFLTLFLVLNISIFAKDKSKKGFVLFEGSFFSVEYPKNFTPNPNPADRKQTDLLDSATFLSPDKKVEFYVFAPQWSGEDEYSKLNSKKEKLQSSKEEKDKGGYIHKWYTYQAKDNSYTKAFHEVYHPDLNTKRILGIKFQSQKDYDKYKKDYLYFKQSLKQFADN